MERRSLRYHGRMSQRTMVGKNAENENNTSSHTAETDAASERESSVVAFGGNSNIILIGI